MVIAATSSSASRSSVRTDGSPRRVLIVEDEALIAMELTFSIEELGHEVIGHAIDETSAIRLARELAPDTVLMDLRLARGTSGIEAARVLFEDLDLRCIFISGNLDPATRQSLESLEPIAMLSKPVLPTLLASVLGVV